MDLYSAALALALAAVAGGAAAAVAATLAARRQRIHRSAALGGLAGRAALAGALLDGFSLLLHLFTGHRPGTDAAMDATGFVREHPAPVVGIGTAG